MNKDDVKMWVIRRGIGHVCAWRDELLTASLCRVASNGPQIYLEKPPRRVCRLCRELLPHCKSPQTATEEVKP